MLRKLLLVFASVFLSALLVPGQARTPDGKTPAEESICDELKGRTPGLHGLCVAFCEAHDADFLSDNGPPNSKILTNYNKKRKAGDPPMPCVQTPCPCWDEAEISPSNWVNRSETLSCRLIRDGGVISEGIQLDGDFHRARVLTGSRGIECRYEDKQKVPPVIREFEITEEQRGICLTQIVDLCAAVLP